MAQSLALTPGTYRLTFSYKPRTSTVGDNRLYAYWEPDADLTFGNLLMSLNGPPPTDWTQYSVTLPDGSSQVQLRFGFVSDNGVHREGWYVDEVRLTGQIPPETDPISDLEIATLTTSTVLFWSPVNGALSYRIYQSSDPYVFPETPVAEVTEPFWVTGLPLQTRRFYMVTVVR